MTKRNYKRKSWEEKKKEIDDLTSSMENDIQNFFRSEDSLKEYLDYMAQFHDYSTRNSALINNQFSGAKAVGSYSFWKSKGFHVNKGEKAIKIFVPNQVNVFEKDGKETPVSKAIQEEKKLIAENQLKTRQKTYFTLGNVFDVSQTNAKSSDLPDIFPNKWLEGDVPNYEVMMKSLNDIAENMDVTIGAPFEELGSAKGAFYYSAEVSGRGHIALNHRNSELQNVKTLIHELAHAELHYKNYELSSSEKEFQAEMVAYTVSSYFGIDTKDYSLPYLHHWTEGKELKDQEKLLNEVRQTSHKFIDALEQDLVKERTLSLDNQKNNESSKYTLIQYGNFGDVEFHEYTFDYDKDADIDSFNQKNKEKFTLIEHASIKEPVIVVKWSESIDFPSNVFIPYDEANEKSIALARQSEIGYDKTWYSVITPNTDGEEINIYPMDRLDIGDGYYEGIHDQVKKELFDTGRITEKEFEQLDRQINKNRTVTKNVFQKDLTL